MFLVLAIRAARCVDEEPLGQSRMKEIEYQWPYYLFLGLMIDDGHWLDDYPEAEREALLNGTATSNG